MNTISPKTRRNISRILPFGIIWLVSGLVFFIVELAANGGSHQIPESRIEVDFTIFIFATLANMGVGLLVGVVEVSYLNKAFVKKSFSKKILYKIGLYTLMLFVITLITFPIAASLELNSNLLDTRVWAKLYLYLTSITHLSTDLQLAVTLGISLLYAEISENIGHGVLLNFFTGKYHMPIEEIRIFMFLDMKSSTSIAEKLGHIQYFELLREYYADLSDPIIQHEGEVYQYVGDEVIVSWKYQAGINHNNCIKCFFAMKKDLAKQADSYRKKYGLAPTFKAGIHFGKVTTGEIGVLKKEIIFTGDILNTTARIQGLCNEYQVDLLVSEHLSKRLDLEGEFQVKALGQHQLRGKKENIRLCAVDESFPKEVLGNFPMYPCSQLVYQSSRISKILPLSSLIFLSF